MMESLELSTKTKGEEGTNAQWPGEDGGCDCHAGLGSCTQPLHSRPAAMRDTGRPIGLGAQALWPAAYCAIVSLAQRPAFRPEQRSGQLRRGAGARVRLFPSVASTLPSGVQQVRGVAACTLVHDAYPSTMG